MGLVYPVDTMWIAAKISPGKRSSSPYTSLADVVIGSSPQTYLIPKGNVGTTYVQR